MRLKLEVKSCGRPTRFPRMETELCRWIEENHKKGNTCQLSQKNLVAKAKELQQSLYPNEEFNASKGWFERFSARHPLHFSFTLRHGKPRYTTMNCKKMKWKDMKKEETLEKMIPEEVEQDFRMEAEAPEVKCETIFESSVESPANKQ